jgi:hypothetical protein
MADVVRRLVAKMRRIGNEASGFTTRIKIYGESVETIQLWADGNKVNYYSHNLHYSRIVIKESGVPLFLIYFLASTLAYLQQTQASCSRISLQCRAFCCDTRSCYDIASSHISHSIRNVQIFAMMGKPCSDLDPFPKLL